MINRKRFVANISIFLFPMWFNGILSAALIIRFSDSWKYTDHDVDGAEGLTYNDGSLKEVCLPHSMSLESPGGKCPTGDIWYRKTFSAEAYDAG